MTIYTEVQTPKSKGGRPKGSKNRYPYGQTPPKIRLTPEEKSAVARRNALSGTPEERSARASAGAKSMWTPEYRERFSKYQKDRGVLPPSRKGKTNKNLYPYSEAVLKRMSESTNVPYKGKFRPTNPSKYDGDPTGIVYRSGIELRFMSYLDNNPGVIKWQSEEFCIPYKDASRDGTWHRYFPDFLVVVKHGTGTLTQLIEVKPASQCVPPKQTANKRSRRLLTEQLTWVQNNCKWEYARAYCADRNWKFKIVTDKDIQGLK